MDNNWTITYYNKWAAEFGCKNPALILTEWIYTDKEIELFQNWLDKRGKK